MTHTYHWLAEKTLILCILNLGYAQSIKIAVLRKELEKRAVRGFFHFLTFYPKR